LPKQQAQKPKGHDAAPISRAQKSSDATTIAPFGRKLAGYLSTGNFSITANGNACTKQ
jgi:hypothetical protein